MKLRNWQKALDIIITQNLKVRGSKMAEFGLITTGHLRVGYIND